MKRILGAILAGLVLALPASYLWFDREELRVEALQEPLPPSRLVTTSDGQTHYEIRGGDWRPRIVLVHGGTVPMWLWDGYVEALDEAGYQVLRYDLFGRGLSDRIDGAYDRELHLRQLEELLSLIAWDDDPVPMVGYSLGAALAAAYAAEHPTRVLDLVLIAPVVDFRDNIPAPARWPLVGEYFVRVLGVPMAIRRFDRMLARLPDWQDRRPDLLQQTRIEGFEDLLLSLARSDALGDYRPTYAEVGRAEIPTLVFYGGADSEIGPASIDALRERLPGARFIGFPEAGHEVGLSRAALIRERMIPWLKRNW